MRETAYDIKTSKDITPVSYEALRTKIFYVKDVLCGRAMSIRMCGASGTGKSTLAEGIAKTLGIPVLSSPISDVPLQLRKHELSEFFVECNAIKTFVKANESMGWYVCDRSYADIETWCTIAGKDGLPRSVTELSLDTKTAADVLIQLPLTDMSVRHTLNDTNRNYGIQDGKTFESVMASHRRYYEVQDKYLEEVTPRPPTKVYKILPDVSIEDYIRYALAFLVASKIVKTAKES